MIDAAGRGIFAPRDAACREVPVLHVVATPIGNLGDISRRAASVLAAADLIAAEDTRRCRQLLHHLGIERPVTAYHDHSDAARREALLAALREGRSIALVSDAGTPLISDPGYRLVADAIAQGIEVVAVPGACAAIAALSVAGLPSDRFVFEGFLPARDAARRAHLAELRAEPRTLIFYESPRRVLETLGDMAAVLGAARRAVMARELTKLHETVLHDSLAALCERVAADPEQQLGEIVLLVEGNAEPPGERVEVGRDELLRALLGRLPLKEAVACAEEVTGLPRNMLYRAALALRDAPEA